MLPATLSCSGRPLAATDILGLHAHKCMDPMSNRAKGLEHFRQARRTVLTQQMRAADDPDFQKELCQKPLLERLGSLAS